MSPVERGISPEGASDSDHNTSSECSTLLHFYTLIHLIYSANSWVQAQGQQLRPCGQQRSLRQATQNTCSYGRWKRTSQEDVGDDSAKGSQGATFQISSTSSVLLLNVYSHYTLIQFIHSSCYRPEIGVIGQLGRPTTQGKIQGQTNGELYSRG